jgi:hypothetical protein
MDELGRKADGCISRWIAGPASAAGGDLGFVEFCEVGGQMGVLRQAPSA